MRDEPVVVIGAGLAGLHAACILASQGVETIVVEQREDVGGFCADLRVDGYRFDIGPTMLQTPEVLTDALVDLGRDPAEYLDLVQLDSCYRLSFADGSLLDLMPSLEQTADNVAELSRGDLDGFHRYMDDMERVKRKLKGFFIDKGESGLPGYLHPDTLRLFRRLTPWTTVDDLIGSYFRDQRIRDAFRFQTLYFGASPATCPALYGMVPYFEISQGVWYARGGLNSIADALARIFTESGGTIETSTPVERILVSEGRARGVRLENGREIRASRVISNADAVYTYTALLPRRAVPRHARHRVARLKLSCSAIVALYGVNQRSIDGLLHHNFLLPKDFSTVCDHVFERLQMPPEMWAYLCYPSRTDDSVAPVDQSALYVLVLVPNGRGVGPRPESPAEASEYVLANLERRGLALRDAVQLERPLTPSFYSGFNAPAGMVLGIQPTRMQIGPLRPGVRSRHVEGLYLTGASANPGAGVPLVIASGRKAARSVLKDLHGGHRRRFRRQPRGALVR